MSIQKYKNLEYLEIKTKNDLYDAINFLEKRFKWSKVRSKQAENELPIVNKHINIHGIMMKVKGDIVGAILFFHQGYLANDNNKISIINLSGWYIHKNYRGLPSMAFLKFMLERFNKVIFTSYSANPIASKIYSAVGFKKMELKRTSLLLSDCILNFSKIKIRPINKNLIKIENDIETKLYHGIGINFLEVEVNQHKIQLIVKKRHLKRSLLGMNFNWRTATIIWLSNEKLIAKYWKEIALKLLLHTKSMKLVCDFSSNFPHNAQVKENNYLYFCNNQSLDYIAPIQSEMNIFD